MLFWHRAKPRVSKQTPFHCVVELLTSCKLEIYVFERGVTQPDTDAGTPSACARCRLEKLAVSPALNSSPRGLVWFFFSAERRFKELGEHSDTQAGFIFPLFRVRFRNLIHTKSHGQLRINISYSCREICWRVGRAGSAYDPLAAKSFYGKKLCTYV